MISKPTITGLSLTIFCRPASATRVRRGTPSEPVYVLSYQIAPRLPTPKTSFLVSKSQFVTSVFIFRK